MKRKLKIGKIYTTVDCCREVRLEVLAANLQKHQVIKGWRRFEYCDERDGMETWEIIEVAADRNNCKLKFLGYEF